MSLRDRYLRTTYRVTGVAPAIDIRVGAHSPQLDPLLEKHGACAWAFVTAWNPGSRKLPPEENRRRQAALEAEIKQRGFIFFRGAGVPDDYVERSPGSSFHVPRSSLDSWSPEESILILGIEREDAVAVGRRFSQAAIVVGTAGEKAELIFMQVPSPASRHH